jgi:GNAT superfamily N-acetyltransferase
MDESIFWSSVDAVGVVAALALLFVWWLIRQPLDSVQGSRRGPPVCDQNGDRRRPTVTEHESADAPTDRALGADGTVRLATPSEYRAVGHMAWMLQGELYPERSADFDRPTFERTAVSLLGAADRVWALVAQHGDQLVGILTLNECAALTAGGVFGEISELYVMTKFRRTGVGRTLLHAANTFAAARSWPFLEVGSPKPPQWQTTLEFYIAHGFRATGPRLERNVTLQSNSGSSYPLAL